MAYADLDDVRQALKIRNPALTTDDPLIERCIVAAQAVIDRRTHRVFEADEDATRRFDAIADIDGRELLFPRGLDLCQLTSVTNGDGQVIPLDQVVTAPRHETPWYALALTLASDHFWTWEITPENAIVIVGRWAYSVEAPDDIVQACVRLASYYYKLNEATVFDVTASPDTGQLFIPKGLPADIKELLEPYKRKV